RLWIPSFYCPEVIAAIPNAPRIAVYRDTPLELAEDLSALAVEPGDAMIVQNIYGLRLAPPRLPAGVTVIEDHSHDPTGEWAAAACPGSRTRSGGARARRTSLHSPRLLGRCATRRCSCRRRGPSHSSRRCASRRRRCATTCASRSSRRGSILRCCGRSTRP